MSCDVDLDVMHTIAVNVLEIHLSIDTVDSFMLVAFWDSRFHITITIWICIALLYNTVQGPGALNSVTYITVKHKNRTVKKTVLQW